MNDAPLLSVRDLYYSYSSRWALKNVCMDVYPGDFLGIIGPNGGGKSTLLRLILGLLKPNQGEILIEGKSPHDARSAIGYVPQKVVLDRRFPISVKSVVSMGLMKSNSFFPWMSRKDLSAIMTALKNVQSDHLANRMFSDLSLGQQQRCLIARALVADPKLLILDEPTASVDSSVEKDIYDLLNQLNKSMTIMIVSHDLGFVSHYVNRVMCLNIEAVCHQTSEISMDIVANMYHHDLKMIDHQCNI